MSKIVICIWLITISVSLSLPGIVLAAPTCNPADTACTGTCTVKPVIPDQQRGTVTDYVVDADNCSKPDYQAKATVSSGRSNISGKCDCIPVDSSGTPLVCKPPSNCTTNTECSAPTNCGTYVCLGFIQGRTPGRCVDGTNLCSKANQTCSTNTDCTGGGTGCSLYTCWKISNKNNACRLGLQPTSTGTSCTPEQIRDGKCTGAAGIVCDSNGSVGVLTAIGCIPTDPTNLVKTILRLAIGMAGGIAFLLMLIGAFQMIISTGNPEALQAGKDRFSSAILGLLFVIFAVLLLKIIGVDILGLGKAFGI